MKIEIPGMIECNSCRKFYSEDSECPKCEMMKYLKSASEWADELPEELHTLIREYQRIELEIHVLTEERVDLMHVLINFYKRILSECSKEIMKFDMGEKSLSICKEISAIGRKIRRDDKTYEEHMNRIVNDELKEIASVLGLGNPECASNKTFN